MYSDIICSLLVLMMVVRIWYDSTFFFTDEEHASLKTIPGPDCYESEILRIRPSEKI